MNVAQIIRLRRGFTLVELLIVIGIMALLFAFALPAFNTMGRGSKVNAAILQLRTILTFARQNAITKNERTFVIFPTDDPAFGTNVIQREKAFRAVGVWSQRSGYLKEWQFLPKGVVFIKNASSAGASAGINNNKNPLCWTSTTHSIDFPDSSKTISVSNSFIYFNPDGSVLDRYILPELYVTEGSTVITGSTISNSYRPKGSRYLAGIEINQLTGLLRVTDYEGE